ncbi:GRAM domain-containing protein 2A isoform X2 [Ictalurus punctatus]|uniref:GRAM domain-containing protein 2A isoform X2 n=1 Tax=Ictalurus punctatus TaxID=7998 RepID=A0A2D0TAE2_ICTPU|nr:GRAM domain-containing protein 2A isoform X2 [Ictalurus punctatus]
MDGSKEINRKFSLDSLGYSLDCGGYLGKSKECKMRRGSESMKGRVMDEPHFELHNKNLQRSSSLRTTNIIEEEGAEQTGLLIHSHSVAEFSILTSQKSFKIHSKTFHKHFPEISEMEDLIKAFTCALQKEVLYHGKMYVTHQHVCFYSSVLLKETKVQIRMSTIQIIKKKNTARVVPNAIAIITNTGDKYLFGSLRNRDVCLSVLKSKCPQLQDVGASSSPQMSSVENGHELEVDTISSHSSQEDSGDPHRFSGQDRMTEINVPSSSSGSNIDSHIEARNNPTSWNSTNRDSHSSEENTAVSWVAMVTEKIRFLLSLGGTTNINKLITVYLILALLLVLSSGYIGLRIAALEEQLSTLGATTEFGLQKSYKET